jgi:hypothetical protein
MCNKRPHLTCRYTLQGQDVLKADPDQVATKSSTQRSFSRVKSDPTFRIWLYGYSILAETRLFGAGRSNVLIQRLKQQSLPKSNQRQPLDADPETVQPLTIRLVTNYSVPTTYGLKRYSTVWMRDDKVTVMSTSLRYYSQCPYSWIPSMQPNAITTCFCSSRGIVIISQ